MCTQECAAVPAAAVPAVPAAAAAAAAAAQGLGQGAGGAWAHFCSLERAHLTISIQPSAIHKLSLPYSEPMHKHWSPCMQHQPSCHLEDAPWGSFAVLPAPSWLPGSWQACFGSLGAAGWGVQASAT
eukprot:1148084-Pelagomonas_calceolata.AAC.1